MSEVVMQPTADPQQQARQCGLAAGVTTEVRQLALRVLQVRSVVTMQPKPMADCTP
jgi:hypothetical protein